MESRSNFLKELFKLIVIVGLIVIPVRMWIVEPYTVYGPSMDPTFATGEYLFVDKFSYIWGEPKRGDVIVMEFPLQKKSYYIKRIVGLPSEKISIERGVVTIHNTKHPEGFILDEPYISDAHHSQETSSVTLRNNEYFVMGDNRRESSDSRIWGPLPDKKIIGTPLVRLWPLSRIDYRPGNTKHYQ